MMGESQEPSQRAAIQAEVARILESAVFSAQGQFEAAKAWRALHWTLGVLTAGLSTLAAVLTFATDAQIASGILAVVAAIAAAVGYRPMNSGQASSTRATWVCWSMTSDTRTGHRSVRPRHGRSCRPWSAYQAARRGIGPDCRGGKKHPVKRQP